MKLRSVLLSTATCVAGLALGAGIGAQMQPDAVVKTVTQEVPVEVVKWKTNTVTEEIEVEVPTTPDACLEALDLADEMRALADDFSDQAARALPLIPDAFTAGAEFDQAAVDEILAELDDQTADLDSLNGDVRRTVRHFSAAATECRST